MDQRKLMVTGQNGSDRISQLPLQMLLQLTFVENVNSDLPNNMFVAYYV